MKTDPKQTRIYHITDVSNLQGIIDEGGLHSDAAMRASGVAHTEIGYGTIKWRRLTQYTIGCCENRFVGEFVPFYFAPRSPMLYTINKGNTGRPPGCQTSILHLVSSVDIAWKLGQPWAISDGNAGAGYTTFSNGNDALDEVDWSAVRSDIWGGDKMHKKMTEFLIRDFFPVTAFIGIAAQNDKVAEEVTATLKVNNIQIPVKTIKTWYF